MRSWILRHLIVIVGAAGALACVTHSPRRTYDYAEIPSDLPAECRVEEPPDHCKVLHLPSDCRFKVLNPDACGKSYGTSPADSRACTTTALLQGGAGGGTATQSEAERVKCFASERHQAAPDTGPGGPRPHEGFDLHVIEFDDEGRPWNADRIDLTLERLRKDLEEPSVVVTFVHGWKNDADVCNGNLSCFRDVLAILAKLEKAYENIVRDKREKAPADSARDAVERATKGIAANRKARRVIGIYVGWRGGSVSVPAVKQLTFWGRKHTAHTIGDNGAVTAFIARLRTIIEKSRPQEGTARNTTAISIGHSFGAALLFSAMEGLFNAQVGEALQGAYAVNGTTAYPNRPTPATAQKREASLSQALVAPNKCVYVPNTGDLVVLVNPAMEASRFANLNQASHLCYVKSQIPVLVTVGSEADYAVGIFFPIGQSFSTLFRAARSRPAWMSMAEGFGMYKPYLTHRLSLQESSKPPKKEKVSGKCKCPSNLSTLGDELVERLEEFYKEIDAHPPQKDQIDLAAYREFLYSRLEPVRDVDANSPFLMVEADREVVGGHSEIFNTRFMDFLIEFVVHTEMKRELHGDYRPEKRR